jgi:uncharacterized protein YgiM (DUF1202 family)
VLGKTGHNTGKESCSMKKTGLYLIFGVTCFLFLVATGIAETMYVTDRLYLSLRKGPGLGEPSLGVIVSDTKVEVVETQGDWVRVKLEDGRAGWVIKKFLVADLPKPIIIEQLKEELNKKDTIPEKLNKENASLKEKIQALENEIMDKTRRLEMAGKQSTMKRLKELYATGILALVGGIVIGYLVRRPKKTRRY